MALVDEVQGRYSVARLNQLSNPDAPAQSTYDATRLAYACTDAEAEFKKLVGVTYDGSNAMHVACAVEGVLVFLMRRGSVPLSNANDAYDRWMELCRRLALVTARDRIVPTTGSVLTPSSEASPDGNPVRPDFDRDTFGGDYVPRPPTGAQRSTDDGR